MTVRTKFKVEKIELTANGETITLCPVDSGSPDNDEFFKYTPPWGKIEVVTVRDVLAKFASVDEFYVDFTRAS